MREPMYTWRLLFADHPPDINPFCGRIGDVLWINKAVGEENIWIKSEGHSWNVWHKKVNYGAKKWNNSPIKFRHSYHPWLQDRLLQFTGTAIGWFPRRQYRLHRASWDQDQVFRSCLNAPTYDELDVPWIARRIVSLVPPDAPDEDMHSPTSSNVSACPPMQSLELVVPEEPAPPLTLPLPPQTKRKLSETVLEETACKRLRSQDDITKNFVRDPPPHISSPTTSALPTPPPPPALSGAFDLQQYLAALPLSLSQHTHIFTALGLTRRAYFESLALMPKRFVDEVIATLRERGLTFMETLVLRNALNTLRSTSARQTATCSKPENIKTFLAGLCPPLERCAPIFQDLGIELAHIPVLAQLDEESYVEFERTLKETDFTWVEIFMIRAGVKGFVEGQQEPLLIAV